MVARRDRALSDAGAVAVAAAAALGAWWSPGVPWWLPAGASIAAVAARRTVVVVVAVGVLAAFLGARAWQGDRPVPAGPFRQTASLVTDPEEVAGAVVAEVRAAGHHYQLWARGWAGHVLDERAAGESVSVVGRVAPRQAGDDIDARRHVVGSVTATSLRAAGDGGPLVRLANGTRRLLLAGGEPLPADRRALYGGFVLGDDRGESPVLAADFQGSGLTHLLVVSGENVAFVMAAAAPLLRRLGPRARWMATMAVLVLFAAMTRFEPSVLRATAMAMIAVTAWTLGRPASGLRVLALAVTAVILVDPMLVGVAGFQLSVAAAAGIILLARPLGRHLPLPPLIARPLAVTLAAQVAVAPLLVALSGGIPVATIPANLLAEPAAGVLMAWGLTVGAVAGLAGGAIAAVIQLPADGLTWWVESVARWGAAAPFGQLGALGLGAASAAGALAVVASRRGRPARAMGAWLAVAVVLAIPTAQLAVTARPGRVSFGGGAVLWSAPVGAGESEILQVGARDSPRQLLDGLRRLGVDHLDLVVASSGGSTTAGLVALLRRRITIARVWSPAPPPRPDGQTGVPVGQVPVVGAVVGLGGLLVRVTAVSPHLEVTVTPTGHGSGPARRLGRPREGAGSRCRFAACWSRSVPTAST